MKKHLESIEMKYNLMKAFNKLTLIICLYQHPS